MVKKKAVSNQTIFVCEVCGLGYVDKETAQECESWCKRTGTCNIEITKKAIYVPGLPNSFREKLSAWTLASNHLCSERKSFFLRFAIFKKNRINIFLANWSPFNCMAIICRAPTGLYCWSRNVPLAFRQQGWSLCTLGMFCKCTLCWRRGPCKKQVSW